MVQLAGSAWRYVDEEGRVNTISRRKLIIMCAGLLGVALTGCETLPVPPTPDQSMAARVPTSTPRATRTPTAMPKPSATNTPPVVTPTATQAANPVETRFAKLARGINAVRWQGQTPINVNAAFESTITVDDIKQIMAMGFPHVRFGVDFQSLFAPANPETPNQEQLDMLDRALDSIIGQGLAATIYPQVPGGFEKQIEQDDSTVTAFAASWQALAKHLAQRDPSLLFLEILSAPLVLDARRWANIQKQVLAAMRTAAPNHTFIAKGHNRGSVSELVALEPLADPNVIYSFQWYEPYAFTHQGATWYLDAYKYLAHLPYPSNPQNVEKVLPQIDNEEAKKVAIQYGQENWNTSRLEGIFGQAAAWAKKNNVRVVCSEFGVYKPNVDAADRNAFLQDIRTILEKNGMGWSMWDYASGFGIVSINDGHKVPDSDTLKALGLA